MADIVLATLNARYIHSAFGLRYLHANLGALASRTTLLEFTLQDRPLDIAEKILAHNPRILGLGIYIWNTRETLPVITALKQLRPNLLIVLGGPEVSYECDEQEIVKCADFVLTNEADITFRDFCERALLGDLPAQKIIHSPVPAPESIQLPYHLYDSSDLTKRVLYVEASRGCPFTCEFCLSSLEIPVRAFDTEQFLAAMQQLLDRGARQFKFVDRTFNLNVRTSSSILQFFLERYLPGLFVHFEMVPDRLPNALRTLIKQFPPGALQFEVGIQTFNPEVAALISRRQNYAALEDNLRFLRQETGVHIHADLIAGLPGEDVTSFARGFDRLVHLAPQEIQVGILKRLRGTPIARHTEAWGMHYHADAPYEVLETKLIPFPEMQRIRRFAKIWDTLSNSGNFLESTALLWSSDTRSPFEGVMAFSDWLFSTQQYSSSYSPKRLATLLFDYLIEERALEQDAVFSALSNDFDRIGRRDKPQFLADFEKRQGLSERLIARPAAQSHSALPPRQARHMA